MSSFMLPHGSSRGRKRKESTLLMPLPLLKPLDPPLPTPGPEVVKLLELLGFCGREGVGQVLVPEAFLRDSATAYAGPRSL